MRPNIRGIGPMLLLAALSCAPERPQTATPHFPDTNNTALAQQAERHTLKMPEGVQNDCTFRGANYVCLHNGVPHSYVPFN
ncbi:MAG: hypothetical protein OXR66_09580 [Candidatus Woesearchaeota archaeon]|nr:hypothetical protein [Candidatus Woesearchaeota archaeon]